MAARKAHNLVPLHAHNCVIAFPKSNQRQSTTSQSTYQDFVRQFAQKNKGKYSGQDLIKAAAIAWNKRK